VEHPKDVGDRSTLAIMLALRDAGFEVLLPFGENTRYDLAIRRHSSFELVQCKTGRLHKGAVIFRTASSYRHHPHPKMQSKHYRGQVDLFAVYCPETTGIYLIPILDLPQAHASLRVEHPRNNQLHRVRFASDYEIGRVAIEGLRGPSGA
jgi:hypothetical protein